MFVGHAALALAARPRLRDHSLGTLLAATFLIDLLWPVGLLLGVERVVIEPGATAFTPLAFVHYPWTHSLLTATLWGGAFALLMRRGKAHSTSATLWLIALVVSHWVLDVVSHRPDLPLWPGPSPLLGLGLWRSVPTTFLVEGALMAAGVAIYLRGSAPGTRRGVVAFWLLMALLIGIWVSGPFAPPPPSAQAIAIVGLTTWLIPLWGWWVE